jgi:hypothetical protein
MSATFCFSVHADPTPCTLPRVLEVFALHGHVPECCHSQLSGPAREDLVIDVQMADLSADQAALVAKRLGRIVNVTNVLWSAKRNQWAAA